MAKALVAYFSASGVTKKLAANLAEVILKAGDIVSEFGSGFDSIVDLVAVSV